MRTSRAPWPTDATAARRSGADRAPAAREPFRSTGTIASAGESGSRVTIGLVRMKRRGGGDPLGTAYPRGRGETVARGGPLGRLRRALTRLDAHAHGHRASGRGVVVDASDRHAHQVELVAEHRGVFDPQRAQLLKAHRAAPCGVQVREQLGLLLIHGVASRWKCSSLIIARARLQSSPRPTSAKPAPNSVSLDHGSP